MTRSIFAALAGLFCLGIGGCAGVVPNFDVPTDYRGVPLTRSITQRIKCELVGMVRADVEPIYEHQRKLLQEDYQVAMAISLDTTDKAGLAPSLSFPGSPTFSFNLNANLDQSREDNLTINVNYSVRDLYNQVSKHPERFDCPDIDTNLAGDLGLRRSVSAALEASGLTPKTEASPDAGEFSGTINFISTKAITSAGPTWTFRHFVGPRDLASASRVNNDKLTFGFASGPNAGKPLNAPLIALNAGARAKAVQQRQTITDLGTQLSGIRNILR